MRKIIDRTRKIKRDIPEDYGRVLASTVSIIVNNYR